MKLFLEMSNLTIERTQYNIAFYNEYYCKQKKTKLNESKTDNYIDGMQQPLISGKHKENLKNLIFTQAVRYGKYYQNDT